MRNLFHHIVGFVFLYCIANATYTNDFAIWQKIIGSIFIGLLFGGFIGAFWEFINKIAFGNQGDLNDVVRTAIGGFFGCLTACFIPNITFITFWGFYSVIALIVVDLIKAIKK